MTALLIAIMGVIMAMIAHARIDDANERIFELENPKLSNKNGKSYLDD